MIVRTCTVDGCTKPRYRDTRICAMHRTRKQRTGTYDPPHRPTPRERFWARVDRRSDVECWLWTGALNDEGYGQFGYPIPRNVHIVAYEDLVGPVPDGHQLDHLCKVRHCVNPAHLEPVTQRVNWERSDCPSRINADKTHCKRGHPLAGDNLGHKPNGQRVCRKCDAWRQRLHVAGLRVADVEKESAHA